MAVVLTLTCKEMPVKKLKAGKAIRFVNRRNYVLYWKSNLQFALSYLDPSPPAFDLLDDVGSHP
jgi:hypothetical protein